MQLLPAFVGTPDVNRIYNLDAMQLLRAMPSESVNCIVTSPPYFGLRDYGVPGQIGLEETPAAYVAKLVELFREARRVLRDDGTLWLNLGDTYANNRGTGASPLMGDKQKTNPGSHLGRKEVPLGLKEKDLMGIPWRVAFALQDDGWILRSDIIWHKPNPMPESVTDRPTKAHEYVFLFAKSQRYWYDANAIREPQVVDSQEAALKRSGKYGSGYDKWNDANGFRGIGGLGQNRNFNPDGRNKRSVWSVSPEPFSGAHFATFPTKLIEPMILAGCPVGGVVLDPFMGSGTTALVARDNGRNYIGSELNPAYVTIARDRLAQPYTPSFMPALDAASA